MGAYVDTAVCRDCITSMLKMGLTTWLINEDYDDDDDELKLTGFQFAELRSMRMRRTTWSANSGWRTTKYLTTQPSFANSL